jgi:putative Ca2+/H+ antiporter (TMEM165/GDT1 family)
VNSSSVASILTPESDVSASSVSSLRLEAEIKVASGTTASTPDHPPSASEGSSKGELGIFASTFLTIFLAELGDKTQLTTLLMSAESHSPWIVFAGASLALVLTSLVGILLGRWLATKVSAKVLDAASGVILCGISVALFWDVLRG